MLPIMYGPGWPPHSAPTTVTASTGSFAAETAWRTAATLWMTVQPPSLRRPTTSFGGRPEVSTKRTPSSSRMSIWLSIKAWSSWCTDI
jgi:hypothetical protein